MHSCALAHWLTQSRVTPSRISEHRLHRSNGAGSRRFVLVLQVMAGSMFGLHGVHGRAVSNVLITNTLVL